MDHEHGQSTSSSSGAVHDMTSVGGLGPSDFHGSWQLREVLSGISMGRHVQQTTVSASFQDTFGRMNDHDIVVDHDSRSLATSQLDVSHRFVSRVFMLLIYHFFFSEKRRNV